MSEAGKQDSDIVCNQLRSFIVDLLTFFCDNHDCDWTLAYQQLNEFGLKIATLLNQIRLRRQDLQVSGGARGPPGNQTYTMFSADFQDQEDTSDSNEDDSYFNPLALSESTEGSSPFDEEIEASKNTLRSIRERLRNLKGHVGIDADSAIEGITSAMGTIGKLRRAKNYSNLQGLI